MAHLKTHVTRGQAEEREAWKWNLVQLLYERDYTEEDIIRFFSTVGLDDDSASSLTRAF